MGFVRFRGLWFGVRESGALVCGGCGGDGVVGEVWSVGGKIVIPRDDGADKRVWQGRRMRRGHT